MSLKNNNISTVIQQDFAYTSLYELTYLPSVDDKTGFNDVCVLNATGVNFGSDTIQLERDNVTKLFKLRGTGESYNRVSTITINFRETDDFKVRNFFEGWQNSFYNKEYDYYYSKDPRRNFSLALLDSNGSTKKTYELYHMVPQNIGSINLSWGNNPQIITYTITFYVEQIK